MNFGANILPNKGGGALTMKVNGGFARHLSIYCCAK